MPLLQPLRPPKTEVPEITPTLFAEILAPIKKEGEKPPSKKEIAKAVFDSQKLDLARVSSVFNQILDYGEDTAAKLRVADKILQVNGVNEQEKEEQVVKAEDLKPNIFINFGGQFKISNEDLMGVLTPHE